MRNKILIIINVLLLVLLCGGGFYSVKKYSKLENEYALLKHTSSHILDSLNTENQNKNNTIALLEANILVLDKKIDSLERVKKAINNRNNFIVSNNISNSINLLKQNLNKTDSVIVTYDQIIETVKHIEVISELTDTMALINKVDIDTINCKFQDWIRIDSLKTVQEEITNLLQTQCSSLINITNLQDDIIKNKDNILGNVNDKNEALLTKKETQYQDMKKRKIIWQAASITEVVGFIALLVLL